MPGGSLPPRGLPPLPSRRQFPPHNTGFPQGDGQAARLARQGGVGQGVEQQLSVEEEEATVMLAASTVLAQQVLTSADDPW